METSALDFADALNVFYLTSRSGGDAFEEAVFGEVFLLLATCECFICLVCGWPWRPTARTVRLKIWWQLRWWPGLRTLSIWCVRRRWLPPPLVQADRAGMRADHGMVLSWEKRVPVDHRTTLQPSSACHYARLSSDVNRLASPPFPG